MGRRVLASPCKFSFCDNESALVFSLFLPAAQKAVGRSPLTSSPKPEENHPDQGESPRQVLTFG